MPFFGGRSVVKVLRQSLLALASLAVFAATACGGAVAEGADQSDLVPEAKIVVHGTIQPQSFVQDAVSDHLAEVAWSFSGTAGDVVAPDMWASTSASSAANFTLKLLGPAVSGKRQLLATGTPRNDSRKQLAIDGFHLPRTGSYLVLVGQAAAGQGGSFTLRFWTSASHAPRNEAAQLDLALRTSSAMKQALAAHAKQAWSDDDVNAGIAQFLGERSAYASLSDAEQLVEALEEASADGLATDAQIAATRQAAAALVGQPTDFAAITARQKAFALHWLGLLSSAVFSVRSVSTKEPIAALGPISLQIESSVASWSGATLDQDPAIRELSLGGSVYGYAADWSSTQRDSEGTETFLWYATDYFDADGNWLGQASPGASEPDDD
jgi:hypothetical protein